MLSPPSGAERRVLRPQASIQQAKPKRKAEERHPLPMRRGAFPFTEDHACAGATRSCTSSSDKSASSEAAFELHASRPGPRAAVKRDSSSQWLNRLWGRPFRRGDAHRLPQSSRYVSAASRQVKAKNCKSCDAATTSCASFASASSPVDCGYRCGALSPDGPPPCIRNCNQPTARSGGLSRAPGSPRSP
jgi:hypothetical protein